MRRLPFLFLLILVPAISHAQHWRVELAGGAMVPADMAPDKAIRPVSSPYQTYAPWSVPSSFGIIHGLGGLKLMRRDSAIEYGISISIFPVHFKEGRSAIDTGYGPTKTTIAIDQNTYLARPAIPVRGFFNYCHHRSKAHAFIGLSAGLFIARGKEMQDANQLHYYEDFAIYFHNATGYTFGGQLGFRRVYSRFDAGMELAINFVHLSLTQGTSRTPYSYNFFYFPLKAHIGYSF